MSAHAASGDMRQKAMDVNRSLRNIKNELENLLEKGAIDNDAFDSLHALLPQEWSLRDGPRNAAPASAAAVIVPVAAEPTPAPTPTSTVEERGPPPPPPADPASNNDPPTLGYATAKYNYDAPNDGDLAFQRGDAVAVHSRVNDDWWLGRNTRSGLSGLFPRQYVQPDATLESLERSGRMPGPEEAAAAASRQATPSQYQPPAGPPPSYDQSYYGPQGQTGDSKFAGDQQRQYGQQPGPYGQPQPGPYGQPGYPSYPAYSQPYGYTGPVPQAGPSQPAPVQAAPAQQQQQPQQQQPQEESSINKHGKKIGGKLGNAFVTGVGFSAGAELVHSIF